MNNTTTSNTNLLSSVAGLGNTTNANPGLFGQINQGMNLMNSLVENNNTLSTWRTLGNFANFGKSYSADSGVLSSLVSLAGLLIIMEIF